MDDEVMFMHVNFANILTDRLWALYQTQKCTDMVLNCGGVIINAHSLIMNIMVPSIFNSIPDPKAIHLDININIMGPLLEYIYKGVTSVSKTQMPELKLGAEKLGLFSLLEGIECYDKEINEPPASDAKKSVDDESCKDSQTKDINEKEFSEPNLLHPKFKVVVQPDFVKLVKKVKRYKCGQCGFSSNENQSYLAHLLTHSTESSETSRSTGVFKCDLCDYVSTEASILSRHVGKKHGGEHQFKCRDCEFTGTSYRNLSRHVQNNHSNDRPFACNLCDYKSKTSGDLRKHAVTHTRPAVFCEICDKLLSSPRALTLHMQSTHLGVNPRKGYCHLCSFKCSRKYLLKAHLKTVHHLDGVETATQSAKKSAKVDGQYECKHCAYKNANYTLYKHHLGVKHCVDKDDKPLEAKHKCNFCDFKGFSFLQLYYHKRSKHNQNNFKCNLCDFQCIEKCDFRAHLNSKHGNYRPFTCGICDRGFITKAGIKKHSLTHGNEKFICEICGNSYSLKVYLAKHIKMMHVENKPFGCESCSYTTRTRQSLKEHVTRMHSENKPPKRVRKKVKTVLNSD